ncbi:hypothetical protein BU16DRAFT_565850 [Lophium mytilinum]|uniref:Uncharacterized protein n=1 Tax=Lophium mytilinum TaxID=390894 RepID=A0A6A6QEU1_9PEZI|nr:hypothetical protein BU16DRAFT_565850 [Lophium mytilinum]
MASAQSLQSSSYLGALIQLPKATPNAMERGVKITGDSADNGHKAVDVGTLGRSPHRLIFADDQQKSFVDICPIGRRRGTAEISFPKHLALGAAPCKATSPSNTCRSAELPSAFKTLPVWYSRALEAVKKQDATKSSLPFFAICRRRPRLLRQQRAPQVYLMGPYDQ